MRTRLIFFLLLFCHPCQAQTIPLDSFFTTGTTWKIAAFYDNNSNYHEETKGISGIEYVVTGDTIVSGTTYHEIAVIYLGDYSWGWYDYGYGNSGIYPLSFDLPTTFDTIKFGRIRTDSNRVYFTQDSYFDLFLIYGYTLGEEYLLYDYNPAADTLNVVDSVTLSDGRHIARYTDTFYIPQRYMLYGIGSAAGLIDYGELVEGPGDYWKSQNLLCYNNPSFHYYPTWDSLGLLGDLQYNCFDMTTLSELETNIAAPPGSLNIFPNPATNFITLATTKNMNLVSVTNAIGQTVFTEKTNTTSEHVNLTQLITGIYFVTVTYDDGQRVTRQFVKSN